MTTLYSPDMLASLLSLLGSASPARAPVIVISIVRRVVAVGLFTCPPACGVAVSFAVPAHGHQRAVQLGSTEIMVPAGKRIKLDVRLSRRGARLLARKHVLKVQATYRVTSRSGGVTTIVRTLVLQAAHRRA